jgi:methylaspartate mutase epsilon subunit
MIMRMIPKNRKYRFPSARELHTIIIWIQTMIRKKISYNNFSTERKEVLASWPTGEGISIDDAVAYHRTIPPEKNFADAMLNARSSGKILLQPRAGVALVEEHIELLRHLETEGGADLLPTTIDAYTRQNRYDEAAAGIKKSIKEKTSCLNGFPAVNHGLEGCRRVVEAVSKPIQVRHGTPDARLLAEITLAAGFTSFEGGGISYNIPYAKKVPLAKSISDWRYVDRLVGIYGENGIRINREPFGPLTGTLVPPCIANSIAIIEGLLALEQGVKSITLGYGQSGNIIQDMAALITLREEADRYFSLAGFAGYELTTVFHQWMGGFPEDEARAFAVICWGGVAGHFARANKIIVKTPHEASGIPTKEANAEGLKATRQALNMLAGQKISGGVVLGTEIDLLKAEIKGLVDKVYELGNGDVALWAAAAFESGSLDVPFAPSIYNRGMVMPLRDDEGFIRILRKGNLAIPDEIFEYHREQIQKRAAHEGRAVSFQMVTDDIYAISKGTLIGRPR